LLIIFLAKGYIQYSRTELGGVSKVLCQRAWLPGRSRHH